MNKTGLEKAWTTMEKYHKIMIDAKELERVRRGQYKVWMWNHIRDNIMDRFKSHPKVKKNVKIVEGQVMNEIITPGMAADRLMEIFIGDSSA